MRRNLLIVEDNERVFESLEINFQPMGFDCLWAWNRQEAIRIANDNRLAAAIIDMSLGDENGIDVMAELFAIQSEMPAIVITGYGSYESAVRAVKMGAYDFLAKPLNFEKLNEILQEALRLSAKSESYSRRPGERNEQAMVSATPAMLDVWRKAANIGATDIPVLVTGESGTGKELVAERIHEHSPRSGGPFVRVNCSAITDTLADSELFGHSRGAFTGASDEHAGLFQQAHRGTLHLDEIGDMSLATQARMLRVLEDSRLRPIGSEKDVEVDVRIVASTNKNLEEMVEAGRFRGDLFYRLNAAQLHLPPLRERRRDIPLLLDHFLDRFAAGRPIKRFSDRARQALNDYYWPGNVRELRNLVKVCVAITPNVIIEPDDLPSNVRHSQRPTSVSGKLTDVEKDLIVRTLGDVGGSRQLAAQRLGISRRTLYNKMKRYELE